MACGKLRVGKLITVSQGGQLVQILYNWYNIHHSWSTYRGASIDTLFFFFSQYSTCNQAQQKELTTFNLPYD